jgi:hypothetical protein
MVLLLTLIEAAGVEVSSLPLQLKRSERDKSKIDESE